MTIADTLTVTYENGRTEVFLNATYSIDRRHLRVRPGGVGEHVISRWDVANVHVVRQHRPG